MTIALTPSELSVLRETGRCVVERPAEPLTCHTRTTIRPDCLPGMPRNLGDGVSAHPGVEHPVTLNRNGAVSAVLDGGQKLGLKPSEFDFVCPLAEGRTYLDGCWRIDVTEGGIEHGRVTSVLLHNLDGSWVWRAEVRR